MQRYIHLKIFGVPYWRRSEKNILCYKKLHHTSVCISSFILLSGCDQKTNVVGARGVGVGELAETFPESGDKVGAHSRGIYGRGPANLQVWIPESLA